MTKLYKWFKKVKIVKCIGVDDSVSYTIYQRHFIFFWWWVPAWVNSSFVGTEDTWKTLEEAQSNLKYFDGSKAKYQDVYSNKSIEKPLETKVKVRVKPFDKECTMYIIEYYIDGIGWERLETNLFYDTVSLCTYNHPVLIPNFDEAVEKAKSLTLEYITKYNSERKIQFDYKMKQLSDKINERNKTFESE